MLSSLLLACWLAQLVPEPAGPVREAEDETAAIVDRLEAGAYFEAVDRIQRPASPGRVLERYDAVSQELYWKRQDLERAVFVLQAGIVYGLAQGRTLEERDPPGAARVRGQTKALAYNLASFTWPGWGDSLPIDERLGALGLEAARTNLRLARELSRGPLSMSRAHWMLGAHHLAGGRLEEAKTAFLHAEEEASKAESKVDQLVARGYQELCEVLRGTEEGPAGLDAILQSLVGLEDSDGPGLAAQLRTARSVFARKPVGSPPRDGASPRR